VRSSDPDCQAVSHLFFVASRTVRGSYGHQRRQPTTGPLPHLDELHDGGGSGLLEGHVEVVQDERVQDRRVGQVGLRVLQEPLGREAVQRRPLQKALTGGRGGGSVSPGIFDSLQ
jgi:hypothetical protein